MKKLFLLMLVAVTMLLSSNSYALTTFWQNGVALDNVGQIVDNANVSVRVTIYAANGNQLYQQVFTGVTTSQFAVFQVEVDGSADVPGFAAIDADAGTMIKVETQVPGSNWVLSFIQPMSDAQYNTTVAPGLIELTEHHIIMGDASNNGEDLPVGGEMTATNAGTFASFIINNNAVTSAKIADGEIVDADVNANAEIAVSKLANGTAGQILTTDGTDVSWGDVTTLAWGLTGNAGTTAGTNFIGTTDNVPFEMRVADGGTTENRFFIGANNEIYRENPNIGGWVLGNARGRGAVDLQGSRMAATQVASGDASTVGGGISNTASGAYSTVGGGYTNTASGDASTVGGGFYNTISGVASTVGGGYANTASGDESTVGGGYRNTASDQYSTVGGGYRNTASGDESTVGGGLSNTASGVVSTVGGGYTNTASGNYSTVGGGYTNTASGDASTVGGGFYNTINGVASTVGGGYDNTASGDESTVGGGRENTASGNYSTVGGGYYAKADKYGQQAYASGRFAAQGDAQASIFVARRSVTAAGWTTLYLDGNAANISIATSTTWAFRVLVVAKPTGGTTNGAGYEITGVVTNNGGTATILGTPTVTTLYESNIAYDARVTVSGANLIVQVEGNGDALRWVARVETAEVTW